MLPIWPLDVAVVSDRGPSGRTDNQRTLTSSNESSVDGDKNDLRLFFPISDGTEQEVGDCQSEAGGIISGLGDVPKEEGWYRNKIRGGG